MFYGVYKYMKMWKKLNLYVPLCYYNGGHTKAKQRTKSCISKTSQCSVHKRMSFRFAGANGFGQYSESTAF